MSRRASPAPAAPRIAWVDTARGAAICLMVVYHFAYDLSLFGWIRVDFGAEPFWIALRTLILGSFLGLVGVSLVLAAPGPRAGARFLARLATIAGCAVLVSAGSRLLFPQSWIYFGVLHAIAVTSVLARPLVGRPRLALALAAVALALGTTVRSQAFDPRWLNWIGLAATRPMTEDYVPLLPWSAAVLAGIWLGHRARAASLSRALDPAPSGLRTLGRHSLLVYMLHQPLLIGAMWLARRLGG